MAGIKDEISDRTIILPITEEAQAVANRLSEGQPTPQKAEQVRLNTLAVSVVNNYLRMMDIPTDITASYSRKPFMVMFNDVADLIVTGLGRLECRPVKAEAQTCHFPVEVWDDRVGYIAVQMDENLQEAALLGFTPTVETEEVSLTQFQPLQDFLWYINPPVQASQQLANLSQWLRNTFEAGWLTLDTLLGTTGANLAFNMRGYRREDSSEDSATKRGKILNLETLQGNYSVVLAIAVTPGNNPASPEEQETDILIRLIPAIAQTFLPVGLELIVLDESGNIVEQAQAMAEEDYLQLPIGGFPGEEFSVRVMLDGISVTEDFVV